MNEFTLSPFDLNYLWVVEYRKRMLKDSKSVERFKQFRELYEVLLEKYDFSFLDMASKSSDELKLLYNNFQKFPGSMRYREKG